MALNKTIVKKVIEKTESDQEMKSFLVNLLELESKEPGRWKLSYNTLLEKSCKEEK